MQDVAPVDAGEFELVKAGFLEPPLHTASVRRSCVRPYTGARKLFRQACARLSIRQSMGRPGSALDNAAVEAWHSTVEFELRSVEQFATRAQVRTRVPAWIEEYNRDRRHSALGMLGPVNYELSRAATRAHTDDATAGREAA
jgi:transposase InsO family protein